MSKRMTVKDAKELIKRIAKEQGVTTDEVRRGIEEAILVASSSDDPKIQERWSDMRVDGKLPSAEELLIILIEQVQGSMHHTS